MGRGKRKKGKKNKTKHNRNQHQQHSGVGNQKSTQSQQAAQSSASTKPNTNMQSLAQKRAAHALACVKKLKNNNNYGNYVSYVKSLPAAILMSGLGQALAMEKAGAAKDGDVGKGHKLLYQHMNAWLCNEKVDNNSGWENSPYANESDVLEAIVSKEEADYIRAQAEALEYLEWLKKFAVAQLREPEEANR